MNKLTLFTIALLLGSMTSAQVIDKNEVGAGASGSLWQDGKSPFLDRTARKEGDLVTILVSESSAASYSAATTTSKQDANSVGSNLLNSLFGILKPGPQTSADGKSSGSGNTTQSGSLRARLTAVVKHVLPNGNLVVEGTRTMVINKETQTFKLLGMIRKDDIAPDNTIFSESIAMAEIRFEGKGAVADRQRKGILTQLLDWLF